VPFSSFIFIRLYVAANGLSAARLCPIWDQR